MRRSAKLRHFSVEHHQVLVLAKRCLQAQPDQLAEVLSLVKLAFEQQVMPHFQAEESLLLARIPQIPLIERMLQEHQILQQQYQTLHDIHSLQAFGQLLHAHVRFEERELFLQLEKLWDQQLEL